MTAYEKWVALITIIHRELQRLFRIWTQTMLPPAITTTLYFVIFGNIIGSRVGTMDGLPYIDFISPGLIMMSMITASYASTVGSFFGMKFGRNIEELLVSPMPNGLIILGFMLGGIARGLITGFIVTIIAMLFTDLQVYSLFTILAVTLIASSIFSLAGMINAIYARNFDDIAFIPTFVLTPLTYLGGVFYSIKLLPHAWQTVSLFNPIVYIIGTFRYGFLGIQAHFMEMAFCVMLLFVIGLYCICLQLLNRGVGLRN